MITVFRGRGGGGGACDRHSPYRGESKNSSNYLSSFYKCVSYSVQNDYMFVLTDHSIRNQNENINEIITFNWVFFAVVLDSSSPPSSRSRIWTFSMFRGSSQARC